MRFNSDDGDPNLLANGARFRWLEPFNCFHNALARRTNMTFDRVALKQRVAKMASCRVYLGTSSWKYEGWRGQLYDDARYVYRGKFARTRFDEMCLAEYAEVFKTVCVDAAYYAFPTSRISRRPRRSGAGRLPVRLQGDG